MIWFAIGWLVCFAIFIQLCWNSPARDDWE
jgi:hypothetical protein